jgi:hypothetical protein
LQTPEALKESSPTMMASARRRTGQF